MKVYEAKCPACQQKLYLLSSAGRYETYSESICRSCKYKFGCVTAKVISSTFYTEVSQDDRTAGKPQHRLVFHLILLKPDSEQEPLSFRQPEYQKAIHFEPNDQLLLLYSIKGRSLYKLLWIENCTTSKSLLLEHPGAEARSFGIASSLVAFALSLAVASVFHLPINKFSLSENILFSIGVGFYISKCKTTKITDSQELERLTSEQNLLVQNFEMNQGIDQFLHELHTNQKLISRFRIMESKILEDPTAVYSEQLDTVTRSISVLEKQVNLLQALINDYRQVTEYIEIEYEAMNLTEQLPNDIIKINLKRVEQLEAIKNIKEEIATSANLRALIDKY